VFNIGGSEMIVLGILALLVFGPEGLPGIIKNVMRTVNAVKAAARDFQTEVSTVLTEENERQDLAKRQRTPFVDPDETKSALPPSQQMVDTGVSAESPDEPAQEKTSEPVESGTEASETAVAATSETTEAVEKSPQPTDDDGPGVPMPLKRTSVVAEEIETEVEVLEEEEEEANQDSLDDGPGIPMAPVRTKVAVEEATEVS
jgi:sec-independent protein translocase protein TatB